jgi:hypothetical protein
VLTLLQIIGRSPITLMTNNQIPMTNEEDNDQLTNNQLNRGKGRTDRLYRFLFWLLVIVRLSGHWNLVIGHYLLQKRPTSSAMEDLSVLKRCLIRKAFRFAPFFPPKTSSPSRPVVIG